jgi:hypothetical protein
MADDGGEIVELRLPVKRRARPLASCDDPRRIAVAPRRAFDGEIGAG